MMMTTVTPALHQPGRLTAPPRRTPSPTRRRGAALAVRAGTAVSERWERREGRAGVCARGACL